MARASPIQGVMKVDHQSIQLKDPNRFIGSNANERLINQPKEATAKSTLTKPRRILVVEDMRDLAELMREILTLHGFDVHVASDGVAGLRLLQAMSFNVALLDIDLPGMSGFEMAERACAAGWLRSQSIVFCTGGDIEERQKLAEEFPGSRFIAKPFAIKGMVATIAEALDGTDQLQH